MEFISIDAARFRVDLRLGDFLHHFGRDLVGAFRPGVDDEVVLLLVGGETVQILLLDIRARWWRVSSISFSLVAGTTMSSLPNEMPALQASRKPSAMTASAEQHGLLLAAVTIDLVDDVADFLLAQQAVDQLERDLGIARQDLRDHHAARRGLHAPRDGLAFGIDRLVARLDLGMQRDRRRQNSACSISPMSLNTMPSPGSLSRSWRQIIEPKHDVLRRHDDRLAVGGRQDVVGRHHQHARFQLRFQRQRHVHGHLVAVEVGVEGGADQRMQLDRLAFDQHRLERLDAQTMQASARG